MRQKLQSFLVFLFSLSLLPYIGFIIMGKVDFLINDLAFTDLHLAVIKSATIVTYINVVSLFVIAIYSLHWSNDRPTLLFSAIFFFFRTPWILRLFGSFGFSLQIVSDIFTFGFILFLILYSYLKNIPRYLKKLNGFTLLSGFLNCSIGIISGIYFTSNPVNYNTTIRKVLIVADIISWTIFGIILFVNMLLVYVNTPRKEKSVVHDIDEIEVENEGVETAVPMANTSITSHNNEIPYINENQELIVTNSFVGDKFDTYYNDAIRKIEYLNSDLEEKKKPIEIPKIKSKDQIYWVCELCGVSNQYFLSKCKECHSKRPKSLYDGHKPVSIVKNATTKNFSFQKKKN